MKRLCVALVLFVLAPIICLANPIEGYILDRIKSQSPGIWDFNINDNYIPQRGGIKVCKDQNKVIVGFYLSQENHDFYNQKFSNGERKPLGFEILITDYSEVFNRDNLITYYTSFPDVPVRYDENYLDDPDSAHVLAISNPALLGTNQWHTVTFWFSEHADVNLARFAVQIQLVGDLYALKGNFGAYYDQYTFDVKAAVNDFFLVTNNVGDLVDVGGNNYFNLRNATPIFDSFQGPDHSNTFFGWPEGAHGHDRYLWNLDDTEGQHYCGANKGQVCDYKPYYCGFGSDPWDHSNIGGCADCTEVDSPYTPPTGNYTGGSGATEHAQPGESDHAGYVHNISMDDVEVTIAGQDDYHHSLTFYNGQVPKVHIRARLKNKTNHKVGREDVTIKWYESPNKTFNSNYDHHFATDHNKYSIGAFEHNSHDDELVERKTNITHLQNLGPGVYYLYPVFYYNGEKNVASKHDHGEYIKITILPRYDVDVVSFTTNKTALTLGEDFILTANIKSSFDQLPYDVRTGFYINGNGLDNKLFYAKVFTAAELATQQTFTVPVLAPLNPGSYTITMKVDDENKLAETNEGNNQDSFVLMVNIPPSNGLVDTILG